MYNVKKRIFDGFTFLVPEEDWQTGHYINLGTERQCAMKPLEFCSGRDVIVQAGGNIGYFAKIYAPFFKTVLTFEPDPTNFYCLEKNVTENNVLKFQLALDSKERTMGMSYIPEHSGMAHIDLSGTGVRSVTLDSLELEACDVIQYDIEGFEYDAILGSQQVITKFHPVISCAFEGHTERYSATANNVDDLLQSFGYHHVDSIHLDRIYTFKK